MDDKFLCGVILGMVGGAFFATKSAKTRELITDGEKQVKEKIKAVAEKNKD